MMRLYADHYLSRVATLVSPGVDELRWLLPVRPCDELSIRVAVLEARPSRSRPDRGIVRSRVEVLNQRQEVVRTVTASNFMLRLPSDSANARPDNTAKPKTSVHNPPTRQNRRGSLNTLGAATVQPFATLKVLKGLHGSIAGGGSS